MYKFLRRLMVKPHKKHFAVPKIIDIPALFRYSNYELMAALWAFCAYFASFSEPCAAVNIILFLAVA